MIVSSFEPAYSRMKHLPYFMFIWAMERIKENYHTFQVLKHAHPKLRKAVISNCDCISECVLNVLNGKVTLTGCVKRKLSKHKLALRKLVDK